MDEEQPLEEPELAHRVVARVDGLQSFLARDADANVGCLDHRHVVGAVTDGEAHRPEAVLDEPDDERLLQRRRAAAHDGAAPRRELEEELLGEGLVERVSQRRAVDDEAVPARPLAVVVPDNVAHARHARRRAPQLRRPPEAARAAQALRPLLLVGRLVLELLGEALGVEEALERVAELPVGRVGLAVPAALDDDEVHVARQEVARLGDGDRRLELVARRDPDLHSARRPSVSASS